MLPLFNSSHHSPPPHWPRAAGPHQRRRRPPKHRRTPPPPPFLRPHQCHVASVRAWPPHLTWLSSGSAPVVVGKTLSHRTPSVSRATVTAPHAVTAARARCTVGWASHAEMAVGQTSSARPMGRSQPSTVRRCFPTFHF
jgi:hypothetical protein